MQANCQQATPVNKDKTIFMQMPFDHQESQGVLQPVVADISCVHQESQGLVEPASIVNMDLSTSLPSVPNGVVSVYDSVLPASIGFITTTTSGIMPLAQHLKNGYLVGKPEGWHRSEERMARRFPPVADPSAPLEEWERELAWMEILLLSGSSDESFAHWAVGWGRRDGHHAILAQFLGEMPVSQDRPGLTEIKSPVNVPSMDRVAAAALDVSSWLPEPVPLGGEIFHSSAEFSFVDLEPELRF